MLNPILLYCKVTYFEAYTPSELSIGRMKGGGGMSYNNGAGVVYHDPDLHKSWPPSRSLGKVSHWLKRDVQ